jgi:hypothetical protein
VFLRVKTARETSKRAPASPCEPWNFVRPFTIVYRFSPLPDFAEDDAVAD